jgi:benzoyl-CoA reductase subunit BamC
VEQFIDIFIKVDQMKTVKTIKIDANKCRGCMACEAICSAFHAEPKYSITNPLRSRIRVFFDEENDVYVPILAGQYTDTECNGRILTVINGKEYGECSFCRASCPSRDQFKEPDAPDIPLKCDMCESAPTLEKPLCVQWCLVDALTYEEREEEVEEEKLGEMETGLESLVHKYGLQKVMDTVARMLMSKKGENIKAKEKD